jgi:hypothetical protein
MTMNRTSLSVCLRTGILLCLCFFISAVSLKAEIIPSSRRISWHAGVPGGIPARATICTTLSAGASASQINSAINSCPVGQTVLLGAGTYSISSQISITKGVTLRGAGTSTVLNCTASWHCVQMGNFPSSPSTISVSGSPAKGAGSITVASTSGLAVNDYIAIDQTNDGVEVVNNNTVDSPGECRSSGTRCLGQIVKITAISGNTLTINPALHHGFSSAQSPQIWEVTGVTTGAGLEDLTITRGAFVGGGYNNVKMVGCSGCWVKNIRSNTPDFWHVDLDRVIWSEVRDSYFNDGYRQGTGGQAYGVVSNLFATANLVENNIFRHLRHGMVVQNGASGNVYGYNYSLECYQGENWLATDMNSHGSHTTMNLWESNIGCKVYGDNSHGSSSYNTVFRNHVRRASTPPEYSSGVTNARRAVDLEVYNRYWNIVGNVLGQSSQTWTAVDPGASRNSGSGAYVYTFGYFSDGDSSRDDATIVNDTYRHANYDYSSQTTSWDSSNSDRNLPDSLYLTSKPSFFGGLPWPAIGSDLSPLAGTIPARERYEGRAIPPPTSSGTVPQAPTNLRIVSQ